MTTYKRAYERLHPWFKRGDVVLWNGSAVLIQGVWVDPESQYIVRFFYLVSTPEHPLFDNAYDYVHCQDILLANEDELEAV